MAGTDFSGSKDEYFRMSMEDIVKEITTIRTQASPVVDGIVAGLKNKVNDLKAKVAKATLNITAEEKTDLLARSIVLNNMAVDCEAFIVKLKAFSAKGTWDGTE